MISLDDAIVIAQRFCRGDWWELADGGIGLYFRTSTTGYIALARRIQHRTNIAKSVLAEELGHHWTTPPGVYGPLFSFTERTSLCRAEQRAVCWAADWLIGDTDMLYIGRHLAEINCLDQLSEFMRIFGVTREIVIMKWLSMKTRGVV